MAIAALVFVAGVGLAFQHVGVEEHWWKSACSTGSGNIADMLQKIGPVVACDEKRPFLFGLTLATYNIFISGALAVLSALVPIRTFRGQLA
jgi:disulfide bond formation protein DsbB